MEWVDLENSKIVKNLGLTWGALLIKLFSLSLYWDNKQPMQGCFVWPCVVAYPLWHFPLN